MEKSLAKNSFFYLMYNLLNMVFPFVTSIYIARVLLPESIGQVAYAQNIVQYFSILAFLGIPTYGLREIAKARNDKIELSRVFSELVVINMISTVVFTTCYYLLILSWPPFREELRLFAVVGLLVVLNMVNISWLYEGMEEFGFIALRNAVFKVLMFMLVLLIVRNSTDIIPYATTLVIGEAGNGIINVIHSRKYVRFSLSNLNLRRHLRSIFLLVIVNLAIEIYTLVDTTMLGMMCTKEHVAYYSYANRVNKMLLQVTNVITIVMVPRISLFYKERRFNEFNGLLAKALKIIIMFAVPMIIGLQFTAAFLFTAIFGAPYYASAGVEKILCFNLLLSPIGYLLGSRVLLVSDNEKKMVVCVSIGAVVNIIGNYILIPLYAEFGAAISSVISEAIVAAAYIAFGSKIYRLPKYLDTVGRICIAAVAETFVLLVTGRIIEDSWIKLTIQVVCAVFFYFFTLILTKESIVIDYMQIALKKLKIRND